MKNIYLIKNTSPAMCENAGNLIADNCIKTLVQLKEYNPSFKNQEFCFCVKEWNGKPEQLKENFEDAGKNAADGILIFSDVFALEEVNFYDVKFSGSFAAVICGIDNYGEEKLKIKTFEAVNIIGAADYVLKVD